MNLEVDPPCAFSPLHGNNALRYTQVNGYTGPEQLGAALSGCDLVVIPAGIPRKPGMSRDDLFTINAVRLWCTRLNTSA